MAVLFKLRTVIRDYSLLIIFILLAVLVISMAAFLFLGYYNRPGFGPDFNWLVIIFATAILAGIAIAMLGVMRDISVLKKKDEELIEKDIELQHFAYSVSHDLKSPLVTIKTFLSCLEGDLAPGGAKERINEDLKYIRNSYDRMNVLLDELFQFSRLGKRTQSVSLFYYDELVREAISLLAGRVVMGRVTIDIQHEPVMLTGDKSQLLAIWQNIIENAIKYSCCQDNPHIRVGVQKGKNPVYYVADNGQGIDKNDQGRIFQIFTKLDPKSEGTGFGLALVKRIVEVYGGKIWVESAGKGSGATFKFTLPCTLAKKSWEKAS